MQPVEPSCSTEQRWHSQVADGDGVFRRRVRGFWCQNRFFTLYPLISREADLPVRHGQPHGRDHRIGPVDPVAAMRGNVDPVAGPEKVGLGLVSEAQSCGASEQNHPFSLALVIPEPRRACLASRDDPLDAQTGPSPHFSKG